MNARVRGLAGAAGRRIGDSIRRTPEVVTAPVHPTQPTQPTGSRPRARPVVGVVEQFSKRLVVGWVSVPKGSPPLRVTLQLGSLKVASTYATVSPSMSGSLSVLRGGIPGAEPRARPRRYASANAKVPLVHGWQHPNVRGPRDDRRNSRREIRTFSFRVHSLWPYLKRKTRVTVRVNGSPLPIYGHGMFLRPPRSGEHALADLRAKLKDGYVLSQYGGLQLSKKLDVTWQKQVMSLYQQTRAFLAEEFGYEPFFIYGTLLGAVRERGYIGHDIDFDAAYLSRMRSGPEAAAELQQIGHALIRQGFMVECMRSCLHIFDPAEPKARIDLFHTYVDSEDRLRFPFGIAGTSTVLGADWKGTQEIDFPGGSGLVPVNAEQIVEHLYGDDWSRPKPGFNWNLDRTSNAEEGTLSVEQRSSVYWADFYARMEYTEGSTFFEFVNSRPEVPQLVLDIGCGDGRDSCAFAAAGRTVVGFDRSEVGIEHARLQAAAKTESGDGVSFEVCDVGDADRLSRLLAAQLAESDGPAMFYLRFFLHSIPEDVQHTLMHVICDQARPGDVFAAEFRTDKDEGKSKAHGKHYRRFQNAAEFSRCLVDDHGFTVLHEEEGTGLSPYKDEDPVLYRVIACRPSPELDGGRLQGGGDRVGLA
ncbi:MAG: class I SAM-dependent methyltransferase [Nocardioidaceae bacterium]|nr:class I SAM-dependent methyltransferase [Nocardioidaceae bacterium]